MQDIEWLCYNGWYARSKFTLWTKRVTLEILAEFYLINYLIFTNALIHFFRIMIEVYSV